MIDLYSNAFFHIACTYYIIAYLYKSCSAMFSDYDLISF